MAGTSFAPHGRESAALDNAGGVAQQAQGYGAPLLNLGTQNTTSGGNFFNTLLNGNRENTNAMLQPDINRIHQANQGVLQAMSTLMPRGGGRSGTLFSLPFQANQQIQSLFNGARSGAAGMLANLGLGQAGAGSGLFNIAGNTNLGISGQGMQGRANNEQLFANLFKTVAGG